MKSVSVAGAAIALSLLDSVAAVKNSNKQSTVHCFTSFASGSLAHVPTKSFTTTAPRTATVIVNSTPVTTITPADVTSTITSTEVVDTTTTLAQNTDTIVSTIPTTVDTTITMDTTTIVDTATSMTTTTTTDTTTIAAPTNFVDASDSLNDDLNEGYFKRDLSAVAANSRHFARAQPKQQQGSQDPESNGEYPRKVLCKKIVFSYSSVTSTLTAATSTVNAPTQTDMATATTTVTNTQTTQPDDASVTNFVTSTYTNTVVTTPSTTSTSTTVLTATVNAPQQTQYAQCAQNNIVEYAAGQDVNYIYGSGIYNYNYGGFSTAYDCCVACALDQSCMGSAFSATQGFCAIIDSTSPSTCGAQSGSLLATLYGTSGDSNPTQFVSNGACGTIGIGSGNVRSAPA